MLPSLVIHTLFSHMAGKMQQPSESVVIRSLRRFKDKYFPNTGGAVRDECVEDTGEEESQPGFLDSLPVRQSRFICRSVSFN